MSLVIHPGRFLDRDAEPEARQRERRRMLRAASISGIFHAAIIAILIGLWQTAPDVEIALPPIPVKLVQDEGRSGAAGGGAGNTAASAPEAAPEASRPSAQTEAETTPPPTPTPTPPETAPTPTQTAAAPPAPQVTSLSQPTPAPERVPQRKPAPPRKTPTPPVASVPPAPAPPAPPTPAPQTQATAPAATAPSASVPAGIDSILKEGVGGQGRGEAGEGRAAIGNGSLEGPGDDYLDRVRAWIARYKKYPPDALAKKQEGKAMLGFTIDRNGDVLDAWIEKSSGNPALDAATLQMIHAASPIPKVPDKYKGTTLRLFMPINYEIGLLDRLFR